MLVDELWPVEVDEDDGGGGDWLVCVLLLQVPGGVRSSIGVPGSPGIWLIGRQGGASTVTVMICPVARRTLTVRCAAEAGSDSATTAAAVPATSVAA